MAETLLKNDLTRFGLRRVHVLATGRVDRDAWLSLVPLGAEGSLNICEYRDEAVGFWHAWLVWHVRGELIRMVDQECVRIGVLWYVENGERISQVIEDAAARHLILTDSWPVSAWVASGPKGMPNEIEIGDETGQRRIEIRQATWVPKRCVFVTGANDHGRTCS